ncbi:MAG: methyltransferase domain-containing protein [Candidatus Omnitrophica bacterium]|nr:methyltransferase domain-containing protein [Candidatus Omnitrophota bacterium]
MYTAIDRCRICANTNLLPILDLGKQVLTGVFPRTPEQAVDSAPLELVKCQSKSNNHSCGLLQLKHSYDLEVLYGDNYGYRSGLNQSMSDHLRKKALDILDFVSLAPGDAIVDIGSNDATLLKSYPKNKYLLIGVDPTGNKFRKYYPEHIQVIPEFFNKGCLKKSLGKKKAKIITSIAMFYDVESPLDFMSDIYEILDEAGVWLFEQSYLPALIAETAYDSICHEHLEYYALKQIKWMSDKVGFKIVDVAFNHVNGGSFSVMVAKPGSPVKENTELVSRILDQEEKHGLNGLKIYQQFQRRVYEHREQLRKVIHEIKNSNKTVVGYGASTRGNVLLQFCGITKNDIRYIGEINEDKFGCFTPGTKIPILTEAEVKASAPDYLFILPWHFEESFLKREKEYLRQGGELLLPLPEIRFLTKSTLPALKSVFD